MVQDNLGLGFVRARKHSVRHGHNVPNREIPFWNRSRSVSYQITSWLRGGNSMVRGFRSATRGLRQVDGVEIFSDYTAKLLKSAGVLVGMNSPHWNCHDQPPEKLKLPRAHLLVKDLIGEGVRD